MQVWLVFYFHSLRKYTRERIYLKPSPWQQGCFWWPRYRNSHFYRTGRTNCPTPRYALYLKIYGDPRISAILTKCKEILPKRLPLTIFQSPTLRPWINRVSSMLWRNRLLGESSFFESGLQRSIPSMYGNWEDLPPFLLTIRRYLWPHISLEIIYF